MPVVFLFFLLVCLPVAASQAPTQTAYDCSAVEIDEIDPATLTKQERIKLMENALLDSVNKYSTCLDKVQQQMASEQGQASASAQGQEQQDMQAQAQSQGTSTKQITQDLPLSTQDPAATKEQEKMKSGGGRAQQVVKPKDNDSIICTMLYEEISKETNEATKKALIKQYEDYNCTK
ncbi:hypothetical protein [Pseudoalteromonas sp. BDTF-M6]|uniref:hypothetical protein n=1 Tax=Pseudoalteromonas sp. BDTF-M6 TaxID=2796132 RepID=UPI001BAEDC2C|nr:hypothetical protein [Pseudoalteromonas sp. BDTF-M6]MBS3799278.1 hypothetical protein [Pseudoalteromonas sp. BDTF-M6]